ncbi:Wzz/FepE/Etk N-terminal domain-containing protein [Marinomonas arenicola]|uniref:Wzz/FepE/Etk N-terminal domain-containing protein n=1 Tax=Marinomonas arenicola TaxID=569601 RepID=A0ABU9G838_9GAMM
MTQTNTQQLHSIPPYEQRVPLADDEIDLKELFLVLWGGKWWIVICVLLAGLAGAGYAIMKPNIYRSDVLLSPSADSSGSGMNIGGQLGGLASLAGISLGGGSSNKSELALQVLKSRKFVGNFIEKNQILASLMASKGWDKKTDTLQYNDDIYSESESRWLTDDEGKTLKPTILNATQYFLKNIMSVSSDTKTGMVTLSIDFYSPEIAQKWLIWLVSDLNEEMRLHDMEDAKNSINYLNEQLKKTNLTDSRDMLFKLIEQQTKTLMLGHARKEYVFETVDPAVVAELPSKPKRKLIVAVSVVLGGFLGCFIVLIRQFIKK